ncbi:hypothetical protein Bhyg_13014 [Pseudolycoriella hygida]|uniref:Uncharacterized protein n=2 Tax=Pseudolycoriella hygida TaxID=35572 RepID=A0A9Q0MZI1_9DIPT|nr:hypothetical protein Bhyg_13014 [Pseudolycoriella hygida]
MNESRSSDTNLTKNESLAKYIRHVKQIKKQAKSNSVTGVEFDNFLFIRYLNETDRNTLNSTKIKQFLCLLIRRRRKLLSYICVVCIIFCLVAYRNETSNIFMKNIQNYIYPLMSAWRLLTLPIIKVFPALTELYDESCLVSNPFFQVKDLDCRPCTGVINVLDLSSVPHNTENVPHIFKTNQTPIDIKTLNEIYTNHLDVFVNDANRVQSTNKNIKTLKDLFADFLNDTHQLDSHTLWRCNRMNPAQILRQIIPKPKRLPNSGMSIERYLAIDTAAAPPYRIPDVDCSSIFVIQLKGTRTILLRPTTECKHKCRTISVRLPQSYVLNFNWWYWKPISLPDHITKQPSISYIGAFC